MRLEVERNPDETWSADLAALVAGWEAKAENVMVDPAEAWQETAATVAWSKGTVQPVVAYDYNTGFTDSSTQSPVKMAVKITLVPLGVGTEADVTAAAVKGLPGVISGTEITVTLPAGSQLPTAGDIVLTLSRYASATAPVSTDGGRTWTFTVTSEDGQTVKNYTLYMAYDVTVENEDGHGTVTATPNPAQRHGHRHAQPRAGGRYRHPHRHAGPRLCAGRVGGGSGRCDRRRGQHLRHARRSRHPPRDLRPGHYRHPAPDRRR